MKKSMNKKIIGGTLIVAVLAVLGAVLVTADADDTTDDENTSSDLKNERPRGGRQPYYSELTEEQQEEINELRQQLIKENATAAEIWVTIKEKLVEFGVELPNRDELLDEQIEKTTQQLEILELQKQLREEGKSWEEIDEIIAEEYDITSFLGHHGKMGAGPDHGMYGDLDDDSSVDDTEGSEEI